MADTIEWERTAKGFNSMVSERHVWVVRSEEGLREFSRQTGMADKQFIESARFATHMLVAIFSGTKPTGGYSIDVVSVEKTDSNIMVHVREQVPGKGSMVTQAITSPFLFITIPASELNVVVKYVQ